MTMTATMTVTTIETRIRRLDATESARITTVAQRMRATLVEVLGAARGDGMYDEAWLEARVRWHLAPLPDRRAVWVAEAPDGGLAGHCMAREEEGESGQRFGLFSTTWVQPEARRGGLASELLQVGEAWMLGHGLLEAATYTSATNEPLIRLYERHGYAVVRQVDDMVELRRTLSTRT